MVIKTTKTKTKRLPKRKTAAVKSIGKKPKSAKTAELVAARISVGPQVSVLGIDGKSIGRITLPRELFAAKVNKKLIAQAIRVYAANQRAGSASTKTRGEVEGSTRKIYRQKGTGRARHGAIRAPIFVGGGIVFGPKPRDYRLRLSQKMRRLALAATLTSKLNDNKVTVVDGLTSIKPKTKEIILLLKNIKTEAPTLLVTPNKAQNVIRAGRNIEDLDLIPANNLHPYSVLSHKQLVFMKEAIPLLKKTFGH